jgi:hypothetical protein
VPSILKNARTMVIRDTGAMVSKRAIDILSNTSVFSGNELGGNGVWG